MSGRGAGGAKALEAAAAAHAMLVALGTDPAHGMLPVTPNREGDSFGQGADQQRTGSKGVAYSQSLVCYCGQCFCVTLAVAMPTVVVTLL